MVDHFDIAGVPIGYSRRPWIIAEMSANHGGDLQRALAIVDAAADAGATALKLQTYTPDTLTLDSHKKGFVIKSSSLWQNRSLYDLYQEAQTPWKWHQILFDHCKKRGIIGFSSPFDESAVEFLESCHVPCYKIASLEILDHGLLRAVAKTGKPVFMSIGAAYLYEVEEAFQLLVKNGSGPIVLLKCTSAYPAPYKEANLKTLTHLAAHFNCLVGLSDHTLGITTSIAAIALGAVVIEKHFTLNRADGGVDSAFSLEPHELKMLVEESALAWQALGKVHYGVSSSEKLSHTLRRSLYVAKDVNSGDLITRENVRSIRPGLGLAPRYLDDIIGKKFKIDLAKATAMSLDYCEGFEPRFEAKGLSKSARIVAIVQARTGSSRLPGKVLLNLGSRRMIDWVLDRVSKAELLDEVVLATTDEPSDDILEKIAQDKGLRAIRGSKNDLLSRYLQAAKLSEADLIVRITSDCPLVDPSLIDSFVRTYLECKRPCHLLSNALLRTYPRGLDVEVVSRDVLEDLQKQNLSSFEKEHATLGIYKRPYRYLIETMQSKEDLSYFRFTVDTALDFGYMDRLIRGCEDQLTSLLNVKSKGISCSTNWQKEGWQKGPWIKPVFVLLDQNPHWSHLNAFEQQKPLF